MLKAAASPSWHRTVCPSSPQQHVNTAIVSTSFLCFLYQGHPILLAASIPQNLCIGQDSGEGLGRQVKCLVIYTNLLPAASERLKRCSLWQGFGSQTTSLEAHSWSRCLHEAVP